MSLDRKVGYRLKEHRVTLSPRRQLVYTIKQIGKGIKAGSHYVPIIKHAQRLASKADPKDYLGQIQALWDDFVQRWRYVRDPVYLETVHVSGPAIYGQILGFDTSAGEHGAGDCDDAAIGMGALLQAIGFPVKISTIAPPNMNQSLFSHVFVKANVPRVGWLSVDPVGYPQHGIGWTPPHNRFADWDLEGNLIGLKGQFPSWFKGLHGDEGVEMQEQYQDYGLGNYAGDNEPLDWAVYGLKGYGAYAGQLGIIDGDQTGLLMEYDEDDELNEAGLVRTKMLEMDPVDYELIRRYGAPRRGALALGDDGDVYQYTPLSGLGFFKKLRSLARKAVGKVAKTVGKGLKFVTSKAKKLISKLPGGKYLVKLHNKLHKVAMKITRPLTKILGKYGKKIAPIAAMIPGYGPVVAAALAKAGTISKILRDTGVMTDKKGRPKFKSGKQAKVLKRRLEQAASREARRRGQRLKRRALRGFGEGGYLLKAGTPEHAAYIRGLGIDLDSWSN